MRFFEDRSAERSAEYQAAHEAFSAALRRAEPRTCSAGACVVYIDPQTGESVVEIGPVECPCQSGGDP